MGGWNQLGQKLDQQGIVAGSQGSSLKAGADWQKLHWYDLLPAAD